MGGPWEKLVLGAVLLAGVALISLSVPRLAAGMAALPGDPVQEAMRDGKKVSDLDINLYIDARLDAASTVDDARMLGDAALGTLMLASRSQDPEISRKLLEHAVTDLQRVLRMSPARPYVWIYLANAQRNLGRQAEAVEALRMSLLTGYNIPGLFRSRLDVALSLAPWLDQEILRMVLGHIPANWPARKAEIVALAKKYNAVPMVRSQLMGDHDALAQFDAAMMAASR